MQYCKDLSPEIKDYLRQHFFYSEGKLYRDDYGKGIRECGSSYTDEDGYYLVKIKSKTYRTHRIIWFLCKGYYPSGELDHIDINNQNNYIENLRECTSVVQGLNQKRLPNKDTGEVGIHLRSKTKRCKKNFCIERKGKHYCFATLEEAIQKRDELNREAYEEMNRLYLHNSERRGM